jgi:CPA1 family monovalent cation:H+ antiporter
LAAGVSSVLGRVAQPLVETLGSLILLVGSLLAAGRLGASGIIAVMCAGVVFASSGRRSLTGAGQETLRTVWDFLAFLANSALFLFIGLQVTGAHLVRHGMLIAVVIAAALAARALTVYGFAAVSRRFGADIPAAWRHVLFWGGLRGGVAIALVLDLAAGLPGRDDVAAAVFGLVVFTLIGQGLSMQPLMRRVGLVLAA